MIFPWIRGFLGWSRAPMTWGLIAANVFIFFLTSGGYSELRSLKSSDLALAGQIYSRQLGLDHSSSENIQVLRGAQALRDERFYSRLNEPIAFGDEVRLAQWKDRITEFHSQLEKRTLSSFGLQNRVGRPLSWITYQFMHSGLWHLLGNMLLLLLFGSALEVLMGSSVVAVTYLLGGLSGAWFFLIVSPVNTAPMVGASASLSAVMAFYALAERKKRVKFFYFLAPQEGFWGEIYLPTLLILPFYFVEDAASFLSTAEEIGAGVAHAAHLGGAFWGVVSAASLKWLLFKNPELTNLIYEPFQNKLAP